MTALFRPSVENITTTDFSFAEYHLTLSALGFEQRCTSFACDVEFTSKKNIALGFDHGKDCSYEDNISKFKARDYSIIEDIPDNAFDEVIEKLFKKSLNACKSTDYFRIAVDVSCFNRFRLASIISAIFDIARVHGISVHADFHYTIAAFSPPNCTYTPNRIVGPIHPKFAGWATGLCTATAAVVGLGYEQDQALGVVEHLQAAPVWAFLPQSPLSEYEEAVKSANDLLLEELPVDQLLYYGVTDPKQIVTSLESVSRGLERSHNVVFIPLGPKVFVLCCLIVAAMRGGLSVWRVSQGDSISPGPRASSGIRSCLRLRLETQRDFSV
ncbi:hypothetical protein LNV09_20950 [Paucibacter sp. B2R-40]|uniref:hypothetical protein n=1 Tax=Paucibacter sp. B2R-40 TaxID=2893554 RepID=UPI0021E38C39|nr:hypothetical protein [Paucibacter sp. B2R-40]MCV2356616.1 hypothetical protein [Paucibacter sp. B2R-40]